MIERFNPVLRGWSSYFKLRLTAVLNAVECASRWREEVLIEGASG
ncbi:group II intron maturase-specific domain-containing protein [Ectopseudomonas oleovorans]|nr:group II intron maturase-specific domain-containing protein [Pseudomonas oleovorans]